MTVGKSRVPNLTGVRTELGKCVRVLVITNTYYRAKQWTLVFLVALFPCRNQVPTSATEQFPVKNLRLFFGLSNVSETSLFTNPLDW
jgi:hypothetical protein